MYKFIFGLLIVLFMSMPTYSQTIRKTLVHNDIERSYRLYVPQDYDVENGGQLIMVLHGGGMDALLMRRITNKRFESLVEDNTLNAIVVYPNGFGNAWNDGRVREEQSSARNQIKDTEFLLALADELTDAYKINAENLYVAGFSNGGGMAYRLACEASERITAIASVANLQASTLSCNPQTSVAILSINGDADPILPLSGGDLFYWEMSLGSVLSSDETIDLWSTNNDCDGYAPPVELPDLDPNDNTSVYVQEAQNCDMPVTSMIIQNGGHTWAGSDYVISNDEYGLTSQEIDTGDVIFDFFLSLGLAE